MNRLAEWRFWGKLFLFYLGGGLAGMLTGIVFFFAISFTGIDYHGNWFAWATFGLCMITGAAYGVIAYPKFFPEHFKE